MQSPNSLVNLYSPIFDQKKVFSPIIVSKLTTKSSICFTCLRTEFHLVYNYLTNCFVNNKLTILHRIDPKILCIANKSKPARAFSYLWVNISYLYMS